MLFWNFEIFEKYPGPIFQKPEKKIFEKKTASISRIFFVRFSDASSTIHPSHSSKKNINGHFLLLTSQIQDPALKKWIELALSFLKSIFFVKIGPKLMSAFEIWCCHRSWYNMVIGPEMYQAHLRTYAVACVPETAKIVHYPKLHPNIIPRQTDPTKLSSSSIRVKWAKFRENCPCCRWVMNPIT